MVNEIQFDPGSNSIRQTKNRVLSHLALAY
jgi:hypothetical protein